MEFTQSEILQLIHNVSYAMVAKEKNNIEPDENDNELLAKLCQIYKQN